MSNKLDLIIDLFMKNLVLIFKIGCRQSRIDLSFKNILKYRGYLIHHDQNPFSALGFIRSFKNIESVFNMSINHK